MRRVRIPRTRYSAGVTEHQDPDLVQTAVNRLYRSSALLDALRLRIWDAEGLTVTQLRLLSFLSETGGLSNADLAERLYVTRPSVSALLERLERGGFIRREISPSDRRGICIFLEDRGRDALSSMRAEVSEFGSSLLEDLSDDDLKEIIGALDKLVAAGAAKRARDLDADTDDDA